LLDQTLFIKISKKKKAKAKAKAKAKERGTNFLPDLFC
jgi:hypothetical protein